MAKKKGGNSQGNTSQGVHSNVSKKTLNAMRKYRNENEFNVEAYFARQMHRDFIMTRTDAASQVLKKRYETEDAVALQAWLLFDHYRDIKVNWGACVQAAKTHYIAQFHEKYGPVLKAVRDRQKNLVGMIGERAESAKKQSKNKSTKVVK